MENINGNIYDIKDGFVYCKSTNSNDVVIFDEKYYPEVIKHRWRRNSNQIVTTIILDKPYVIRMDKFIYELEYGPIDDNLRLIHTNGDRFDSRICNMSLDYNNRYEFDEDIVIGYTNNKNTRYIFNKKYFPEVSKRTWNTSSRGVISAHMNDTNTSLGRFIYELINGPVEFGEVRFVDIDNTNCLDDNLYLMDNRNQYTFEGDIAIGQLFNDEHKFIIDRDMYEYAKDYIFGIQHRHSDAESNVVTRTSKYCYSLFYLVLKWHGIDPGNAKLYAINGDKYDCRFCNIGIRRNDYDIVGDIAYGHIPTSDVVYIVDARFVPEIQKYKCVDTVEGYIEIYYDKKKHKLHRTVCELAGINLDGLVVHHINGNKYDDRLCNLFVCTPEMHKDIHYYNLEVQSNINTLLGLSTPHIIQPFVFI